jgi:hypothetical protein
MYDVCYVCAQPRILKTEMSHMSGLRLSSSVSEDSSSVEGLAGACDGGGVVNRRNNSYDQSQSRATDRLPRQPPEGNYGAKEQSQLPKPKFQEATREAKAQIQPPKSNVVGRWGPRNISVGSSTILFWISSYGSTVINVLHFLSPIVKWNQALRHG